MSKYSIALGQVMADQRYIRNIQWGEARPGHPEGSIACHIAELEDNLAKLSPKLSVEQIAKLRLLIHVHDTFKPEAEEGAPIGSPRAHGTLAAGFLSEFIDDADLVVMTRLHDEPYALWRGLQSRGKVNQQRLQDLIAAIGDWDTFLAFQLIDNLTEGKSADATEWFIDTTSALVRHRLRVEDVRRGGR